jgi:hypothetical protein
MERCNSTLQREFNRSEAATWSGRRTLSVCGSTGRAGSTRRGPSGPRGRAGRAVRGGAGDVPRAFAHGWAALSLPLRLGTPGPAAPARLVLFLSESPFRSDPPDGRRCHVAAVSYQRGRASGLGLDPGGGAGGLRPSFTSRTEALGFRWLRALAVVTVHGAYGLAPRGACAWRWAWRLLACGRPGCGGASAPSLPPV